MAPSVSVGGLGRVAMVYFNPYKRHIRSVRRPAAYGPMGIRPGGTQTLTQLMQSHSPLGYWKLDDAGPPGAGDVLDYSANEDHATTSNVLAGEFQAAGPDASLIPYAMTFGGSNEGVICPYQNFAAAQDAWTVGCWFKAENTGLDKCMYSEANGSNFQLLIRVNSNGIIRFFFKNAGTSMDILSANTYETDAWNFISVSRIAADSYRMRINDGDENLTSSSSVAKFTPTTKVIGFLRRASDDRYFKGELSEVFALDKAWSTDDHDEAYAAGGGT